MHPLGQIILLTHKTPNNQTPSYLKNPFMPNYRNSNAFIKAKGDVKHVNVSNRLSNYTQYMTCSTWNNKTQYAVV